MKIKIFISIFYVHFFCISLAMERPEPPQAKQPLPASEFETRFNEEINNPKTATEIRLLTKKAEKGDVESQVSLAYALFAQGNPQQALVWLKKAESKGRQFPPIFFAELYFNLNDLKNAEKFAQQAIAQNDPHGYAILGYIKVAEADLESALTLYAKAIEFGYLFAYFARALLYIDQHKKDLAEKDLQKLIESTTLEDTAKGLMYYLNNDTENAIEYLTKSHAFSALVVLEKLTKDAMNKKLIQEGIRENIKSKTLAGPAYYHSALFALQDQQKQKAVEYLEKSLQYPNSAWVEPSFPGNAYYTLYKLNRSSNPEEARTYLLEAGKFGQPRAALRLGIEYYRNKDLPKEERLTKAKKYLQIAADKGELPAIYNLALIAEYEKDYAKAKELFGQLIKDEYLDAEKRLREMIKKQLQSIKK